MSKDIRFLLVILLVALAILVWLQSQKCNAVPNSGAVQQSQSAPSNNNARMTRRQNVANAAKTSQQNASKMIDNILKNEKGVDLTSMGSNGTAGTAGTAGSRFTNPLIQDVNNDRNSMSSD